MKDSSIKRKTTMMSDYIPQLMELYPGAEKEDLYKVIKSFLMSFLLLLKEGASIMMKSNNQNTHFFLINGLLTFNTLRAINKYRLQMTKKIRIKFRNLKREWNGYYYFALSDKEFARILAQKKKNHRKNIYIFSLIVIFKLFEECMVHNSGRNHIFRIKYPIEFGWKSWKKDFACKDFEYIYRKDKEKGLIPITKLESRQDNNLFKHNVDFNWLVWVDKDLVKKLKTKK